MMKLRKYETDDISEIATLFYECVHSINQQDYSPKQLDAWANGNIDLNKWNQSFLNSLSFVVSINDILVGFADMDDLGYLDHLYVHKDYQRQGIATILCDALENSVHTSSYYTNASITAIPFFEKRGYHCVKKQEVIKDGISLINYRMEKKAR